MAKTLFSGNAKDFSQVNAFLNQFDKKGKLLSEYKEITVPEWISTGSYVLNACISGSLLRGVPAGRIITISGDPKTGKSYVCLECVRNLQEKGYFVIYYDTEFSADSQRFQAQGVNPDMIRVVNPDTINDITIQMTQMLTALEETKEQNEIKNKKLPDDKKLEIPKYAFVIDSITALTSSKQTNDILSQSELKNDMGFGARELKVLFNTVTPKLGRLGYPMICTAHEYVNQQSYTQEKVVSGGRGVTYMSSVLVSLRKRFDKDENKQKQGILVTASITESRFSVHRPVEFYISFARGINPYMGLQQFVSWDVCGITRGKMVNYVDIPYELQQKKLIDNVEEFKTKKFKISDILSVLSKDKKEAFKISIQDAIEKNIIKIVSNDSTVVLPDFVDFLQSYRVDLYNNIEVNIIREKMTLAGIYSPEAITKYVQTYIDEGSIYVVGNGKFDPNKNQKLACKKPFLTSIEDGSYIRKELEVELPSAVGTYNEKVDQTFIVNYDNIKQYIVDGRIHMDNRLICMPNSTSPDWVIRHLNRTVKDYQLFNKQVFNDDVLKAIDEKIVQPAFSYKKTYERMEGNLSEEEMQSALAEDAIGDYNNLMEDMMG